MVVVKSLEVNVLHV